MFLPMTNAPASTIAAISAAFSSAVSNIHRCRSTPAPNGCSSVWSGREEYPSTDTATSHVTFPMPPSPSAVRVRRDRRRPS